MNAAPSLACVRQTIHFTRASPADLVRALSALYLELRKVRLSKHPNDATRVTSSLTLLVTRRACLNFWRTWPRVITHKVTKEKERLREPAFFMHVERGSEPARAVRGAHAASASSSPLYQPLQRCGGASGSARCRRTAGEHIIHKAPIESLRGTGFQRSAAQPLIPCACMHCYYDFSRFACARYPTESRPQPPDASGTGV